MHPLKPCLLVDYAGGVGSGRNYVAGSAELRVPLVSVFGAPGLDPHIADQRPGMLSHRPCIRRTCLAHTTVCSYHSFFLFPTVIRCPPSRPLSLATGAPTWTAAAL